jgi:hypothetical protein
MNEALFYPFAPKRDLIDASSRIYDMNASAPMQNEGRGRSRRVMRIRDGERGTHS